MKTSGGLARLQVLALYILAGCTKIVIPSGAEFSGEAGGCGDFVVYRFNDTKTLAAVLYVDETAFAVAEPPVEIEVAGGSKSAFVEVLQFRRPAMDYFCDDVGGDAAPIATWKATSGSIVIESYQVIQPGTKGNATHQVTVVLRNVRLRQINSNQEATLNEVRFNDVLVGWKA